MRIINSCVWMGFIVGAIGCSKVPVRNIYCDGTSRYGCGDPAYPSCDPVMHVCVAARDLSVGNGDMPPAPRDLAAADLATNPCHTANDCPAAQPICNGNGNCRACTGSGDDGACLSRSSATPRCLASSGMCAACSSVGQQTSDCPSATPVCNSDGTCRGCGTHEECTTQLCNSDGTCASGNIAYADNANGTCSGVHAGTLADRACEISAALLVQPTVRVFGSTASYAPLTLASGTVRIVGPDTSPTAIVAGTSSAPAVSISGASTDVTLDSLEITSGTGQDGIFCSQASLGPSLTMVRSAVHDAGGAGIDATKCTVTLDRDAIGPNNATGGIVLSGAKYAISNSFVFANAAGTAGVTFNTGSTATGLGFQFNTVAKNAGGGIACNVAAGIANAIVWGNTGSDTTGTCTLTSVVSTAPDFVNATGPSYDFHLAGRTATNLACCVDQLASGAVNHDYDGRHRPQNLKWDIGAHEVP